MPIILYIVLAGK